MDYIKRFTTREGVRMSLAVTTDTVETARVRHDLWPVATAALGRAMTGAILLAGDFKNHENVSLRIKGDGPLGVVHVDAFADIEKALDLCEQCAESGFKDLRKRIIDAGKDREILERRMMKELDLLYTTNVEADI